MILICIFVVKDPNVFIHNNIKVSKNVLYPYSSGNTHPGFSVDCVILTFHEGQIKVLLGKRDIILDFWALPGGFMFKDEDADSAARRALNKFTGLEDVFIKQFYLFSDPGRTIIEQNRGMLEKQKAADDENNKWFLQRFVTLGYYSLVRYEKVQENLKESDVLQWYNISDIPTMYSDHQNIIHKAFDTIKKLLPAIPVAYELLPEKFTMFELRRIYEIILDRTFDRRNFQRKVLMNGNIIQLDERKNSKAYNPPILYSFDPIMEKNITTILNTDI